MPDEWQLELLTDEILREELTDNRKNKARVEEYPILSRYQLERRMYGINQRKGGGREIAFEAATNIATDGKVYYKPGRRELTISEMVTIDINSRPFDAESRKRYEDFIKPSEVKVYYIGEQLERLS